MPTEVQSERWSIMAADGLTLWREDLFTREEALDHVRQYPRTPSGARQIAAPEGVIRRAAFMWRELGTQYEAALHAARLEATARLVSEAELRPDEQVTA